MAASTKKTTKGNAATNAGRGKVQNPKNSDELTKLFKDLLKDTLSAEKQLVKALPKMAKASTSPELKKAFQEHLEVTKGQVTRLEEVFGILGAKPASKLCKAMQGLVEEGEEAIEETEDGTLLRDVVLIVAAQKVEHYEIAAYGSLRSLAKVLGHDDAAALLQETLDEEGDADKLLTGLSDGINEEAYTEAN